jgi:hypothetical protein
MSGMHDLATVAPAFVEMAHRIVWCSVATVDESGHPRSRILHPLWTWDGSTLVGHVGTMPTATKRAHLAAHPYASCSYWAPSHDHCIAECHAELVVDDETRTEVWNALKSAPPPVGYDPTIIEGWTSPTVPGFAVLVLRPWRLRVFPGTFLLGQGGDILTWSG